MESDLRETRCIHEKSSETRRENRKKESKKHTKKKKKPRARHPRSISSTNRKRPKNAVVSFLVGFGFVLSEIPIPHYHYPFHYPFTIHIYHPSQPLYSSFSSNIGLGFYSPSTSSGGVLSQVEVSGLFFCTVLFYILC
jgi:hypothetical protein